MANSSLQLLVVSLLSAALAYFVALRPSLTMSSGAAPTRIGVIGAMPEEIAMLKAHTTDQKTTKVGSVMEFHLGKYAGHDVVFTSGGVGMVSAAAVAATLVAKFEVDALVFTGVAGGLKKGQSVGDIIIAKELINYDNNVKAFHYFDDPSYQHKRGELPFSKWRVFESDPRLVELALKAPHPTGLNISPGLIVTGSEFLTEERKVELQPLWEELGNPDAVEMECAAVAQVAKMHGIPFLGLRALSDTVDGDVSADFHKFCQEAADHVWPILQKVLDEFHA